MANQSWHNRSDAVEKWTRPRKRQIAATPTIRVHPTRWAPIGLACVRQCDTPFPSSAGHQFRDAPHVIDYSSGHRWRDPQFSVNPAEVVEDLPPKCKASAAFQIVPLFRERISGPREPLTPLTKLRPILALDVGCTFERSGSPVSRTSPQIRSCRDCSGPPLVSSRPSLLDCSPTRSCRPA